MCCRKREVYHIRHEAGKRVEKGRGRRGFYLRHVCGLYSGNVDARILVANLLRHPDNGTHSNQLLVSPALKAIPLIA